MQNEILTPQMAISWVVNYRTLPRAIDYVGPWQRKATKALLFIQLLSPAAQRAAEAEIEKQIDAYYTEGPNGYSAAEMNDLIG